MVVAIAPVVDLVKDAPWWVQTIVAVGALLAPYVLTRPKRARGGGAPDEDEEDLRELRDQLVKYLQRAEKAERELAIVTAEAKNLKSIVDALIDRRAQTPPRGTPPPGP